MGSTNDSGIDATRGVSLLVLDAVEQITNIVEAMHANIASASLPLGAGTDGKTRGITGFVYDSIRFVNSGVRVALDRALALVPDTPSAALPQPQWETVRSAVNGVLGDYLAQTRNPLAITMQLRRDGEALLATKDALASALPDAGGKLLVLVHGLCMNDRQWTRNGHDHGAALASELGYTPVYLHYNSGRHVSENGRDLAELLERLVSSWPVPVSEIAILAHNMGGLVARSAVHVATEADHTWTRRVRRIVFLGTPHHGAPLERGGNWFETIAGMSPYTGPIARLGMLRSCGVTDLRFGSVHDDDWQGRSRFERTTDRRRHLPLPIGVECFAVAATMGRHADDLRNELLGDGLVQVASALGRHTDADRSLVFAEENRATMYGLGHLGLLESRDVFAQLCAWLGAPAPAAAGSL